MVFFKYLFIFCLFSVVGWVLEVGFRSFVSRKFINPGFMSGCVVPLYGFGAVILDIICNLFVPITSKYKVIIIFILSMILLSILEFISGYILLKFFNLKLWDYSMFKYNYKGFICLEFSILWGLLSLIFYTFVFPWLNEFAINFISNTYGIFFLGIFVGVFLVDLCVSVGFLNRLTKYAKEVKEIIELEKLKLDVRRKNSRRKILNALYPYLSTNRYLKERLNELKGNDLNEKKDK